MKPVNIKLFNCHFLILAALISFCFLSCKKTLDERVTPASSEEINLRSKKPNIIFILADDIGYEIPSCNGGESYSTPNIDLLAASGMRFTQCQSCPNCSPSRVELLTGKYNFRNYTGWGSLDTTQKTFVNMLHDAGYKTCVAGKWQLDGGDVSLHKFGFDKYRVFLPFYVSDETSENKRRYKNPKLYEHGHFLPDSVTAGKYADDMFVNYIARFIDSNSTKPFFVLYSMSLCHVPFYPTPDDPEFATWDPLTQKSDEKFFPSMVKYMDKKIKQVINKVNDAGLADNTVIVFAGDNGTSSQIVSVFNGKQITGGKATPTIYGTRVPLIVKWPGTAASGQVNNALIDFSDFLPTLAGIAHVPLPLNYGTLDGVSFVPALRGADRNLRDWSFCYWKPDYQVYHFKRWVQDTTYKLYDSTNQNYFFNISIDPLELNPIPNEQLTDEEQTIKHKFRRVLKSMHN
jgi:arylsulfatase A